MRRSVCVAASIVGLAQLAFQLGALGVARADDKAHPAVHIGIDACVSVVDAEVRAVVAVELGALITDASSADTTRVEATCKDKLVELRVEDPITGKSLTRTVDILSAAPKARARLLALAIVELVSASWTELESNPQPQVPAAGPKPSAAAKDAARNAVVAREAAQPPELRSFRLMALVDVTKFFPRTGPMLGLGVRFGDDASPHVAVRGDMQLAHATVSTSLGSIAVDTVSLAASIMWQQRFHPLSVGAGLGFRGGFARFTGEASQPEAVLAGTLYAPWGGPTANGAVSIQPFRILIIELVAEAGYVILPVRARAAGSREAAVDGLWFGGGLAVGVTL